MTDLQPTRIKAPTTRRVDIGRAARLTGLTLRAIRFYEQRGLVEGQRNARMMRTYDEADLARLGQIAELRAIGISIEDIIALLDSDGLPGGNGPAHRLHEVLRQHQRRLLARLAGLDALASRAGLPLDPSGGAASQGLGSGSRDKYLEGPG